MLAVREENQTFPILTPLWDDPLTAALVASGAPSPLKEGFSGPCIVFSTGRENDGTGLYYYRARYYSPTMQRFVSEDPIRFLSGDFNLYAYVGNNPLLFIDPFGLEKKKTKRIEVCTGSGCFPIDVPEDTDTDRLREQIKNERRQEFPKEVKDRVKDEIEDIVTELGKKGLKDALKTICKKKCTGIFSDLFSPNEADAPMGPGDF